MGKILRFAAVVEIATGLALLVDPRLVVMLLVGESAPAEDIPMGRLPGIAILALGLACWPDARSSDSGGAAFRAMLVYNVLIALFLIYLFAVGHLGGILLWPGVILHAVVALLLVRDWSRTRSGAAGAGN